MAETIQPIDILLVEDDPGDVRLTKEVLKDSKVRNTVRTVDNGVDALAFLQRQPPFQDAVRPDVILLDLNLPKMNGREVLERIKSDPDLTRIPIVVLSSSADDENIVKSYHLRANAYVTKPVGLDQFVDVVQHIEGFGWPSSNCHRLGRPDADPKPLYRIRWSFELQWSDSNGLDGRQRCGSQPTKKARPPSAPTRSRSPRARHRERSGSQGSAEMMDTAVHVTASGPGPLWPMVSTRSAAGNMLTLDPDTVVRGGAPLLPYHGVDHC